jgi:hypothetical protein
MVHDAGKWAATGGVGFDWLEEKLRVSCFNGDNHCGW